jgi:hypothetical protein
VCTQSAKVGLAEEVALLYTDCNVNARSDFFDALDCDDDGIFDECDPRDCNINGIPDECDIADCAGDPACADCNTNGIPDECDISVGPREFVVGDIDKFNAEPGWTPAEGQSGVSVHSYPFTAFSAFSLNFLPRDCRSCS